MKKLMRKIQKIPVLYIISLKLLGIYNFFKIKRLKKYSNEERQRHISKMYYSRTGLRLDWNNLSTYTEKMQWAKLYDCSELKGICADKYTVRQWVADKIGEEYLIPLIGKWSGGDEIDFDKLPSKFVLKTSNGSGTNIIVKDKSNLNILVARARLNRWLHTEYAYLKGFEMHYALVPPCIIAEQLIECPYEDLPDYKFLCFMGKVYYCWVDIGRYHNHKRNVYDLEWNLMPWNQYDYGNSETPIDRPKNFEKMIEIASTLCKGFSHVRVDLYNIDGRIYFGEMTFTNGSGYELINPAEYNKMLGDLWKLPVEKK